MISIFEISEQYPDLYKQAENNTEVFRKLNEDNSEESFDFDQLFEQEVYMLYFNLPEHRESSENPFVKKTFCL